MSGTADTSENLTPLKRALLALEKMQRKLDSLEGQMKEPIAVIGIGCRAPGNVSDPESFWKLLHDGVDAIREYPRDRGSWDALYDPDRNAPESYMCERAASRMRSTGSMLSSSAFRPARPSAWIRNIDCCSKPAGKL